MRVWVADDKPELVAEITEYQNLKTGKDPQADLGNVEIMGITNRAELKERISRAAGGLEPMPDVIFLDLSFDRREDGIEALKFLKYNKFYEIRNIPVIIYSQSDSLTDVYVTISFRANAYMTKEGGLKRFWDAVVHWKSTQLAPHRVPVDLIDDLDEPKKSRRKYNRKVNRKS